jgi:hypothetical protein
MAIPSAAKQLRNAPSILPTTLRFIASRLARRWRGESAPAELPSFRERVEAALAPRGARIDWLVIEANSVGWQDSGIDLAPGEVPTLIADGMLYISRALDVGFAPKVGLWYRIGDGELAKALGRGGALGDGRGGRLRFVTKPPGEFADRLGAFEADQPRNGVSGRYLAAVIRWQGEPAEGLAAAAKIDPELFGPLLAVPSVPEGWRYLWRLGEGEIFRHEPQRAGELCCRTSADVGILQHPVDVPLTEATRLDWSWLVSQLPSALPEHTQPTHDYLSIAAEFDNGLDLTWMWSCGLPVGTVFQCPLPWWDQRETHWVVRSGSEDLGRWLDESRPVLADYRSAIGGEAPRRLVAIWLIANTAFQRGIGEARYRSIRLVDGAVVTEVPC